MSRFVSSVIAALLALATSPPSFAGKVLSRKTKVFVVGPSSPEDFLARCAAARVGDEFKGSYVKLWGAREGKPSELVIDWAQGIVTSGPQNTYDLAAAVKVSSHL